MNLFLQLALAVMVLTIGANVVDAMWPAEDAAGTCQQTQSADTCLYALR